MGAVTYPDKKVVEFVEKHFVPVQVAFDAQPLAADFRIAWTPTLITLDAEGKEHHRTIGFLPPEELIPSLLLGMAKIHFDQNQWEAALSHLEKLLADFPKSDWAPEAIYIRGVCRYKTTKQASHLKEIYEHLEKAYPSSEWTKRANPYRLL